MKRLYIYRALGVFFLCLLSSCGDEQEACAPDALEISAEIVKNEGNAVSRADIPDPTVGESNFDRQAFLEGDVIGVYLDDKNDLLRPLKKQGSRWLTSMTTSDGKIYNAVFPYYGKSTTGTGLGTVNDIISSPATDQSTKEKYLMNNKLVAKATTVGNHLSFKFKHAFAKFTVVVNYSGALVPNKAIVAINSGTGGTTLCRTSGDASGKVHSYVGIIRPTTDSDPWTSLNIKVTTGAEGGVTDMKEHTEDFRPSSKQIKAGYHYRFTFSATDELILTGVTVTDFDMQPEEDMGSAT